MHLRALLVVIVIASPIAAAAPPANLEKLVVGNWLCVESCFDEEYAFELENGERLLRTYTHARPSIWGAAWTLEGNRLRIFEDDKKTVRFDFRVVRATAKRLVLKPLDREGEPDVVLDRIVTKPKKAVPAK